MVDLFMGINSQHGNSRGSRESKDTVDFHQSPTSRDENAEGKMRDPGIRQSWQDCECVQIRWMSKIYSTSCGS